MPTPPRLAHCVFRTNQLPQMVDLYCKLLTRRWPMPRSARCSRAMSNVLLRRADFPIAFTQAAG